MSHVQVGTHPEPPTMTDEPVLPQPVAEEPAAVAEGLGRPGAHTNGIAQHAVDVDAQQTDANKVHVPSLCHHRSHCILYLVLSNLYVP